MTFCCHKLLQKTQIHLKMIPQRIKKTLPYTSCKKINLSQKKQIQLCFYLNLQSNSGMLLLKNKELAQSGEITIEDIPEGVLGKKAAAAGIKNIKSRRRSRLLYPLFLDKSQNQLFLFLEISNRQHMVFRISFKRPRKILSDGVSHLIVAGKLQK